MKKKECKRVIHSKRINILGDGLLSLVSSLNRTVFNARGLYVFQKVNIKGTLDLNCDLIKNVQQLQLNAKNSLMLIFVYSIYM